MDKVLTGDGSFTLRNPVFDETYHSVSGAIEEAREKYVVPCGIRPGMKVLDVCFGLGYNSLMAIHATKRIDIVGLENDLGVLSAIQSMVVPDELSSDYAIVRKAAANLSYDDGFVRIRILLGDAREKILEVGTGFDAVLFDPFSPKKCPQLWAYEFFVSVFGVMKPGAVLATYSCARVVRDNLAKAGFEVRDGPCVGRRAPGTVAVRPVFGKGLKESFVSCSSMSP